MAEPLPQKVRRTIWRGDTRTWTHVFEDVDGTTVTPRDMTGHTFLAQWRADDKRGDVIAVSVFDTTDADQGIIVETLTAEEADKLIPDDKAFWDLQSTSTELGVRTWYYSDVIVKGDRSDG